MRFKPNAQQFLRKKGLFLFSALAVFMVLSALYWLYFNLESERVYENQRELLVKTAQTNISSLENSITRRLDQIEATALLLASDRDLAAYLTNFSEKNHYRIYNKWMSLMEHKRVYSSFRFMTEEGWERMRINYDSKTQTATPSGKLHYKGDQDYFLQATKLEAGQVGATPMDLETALGRHVMPYAPRFRYFSPLVIDGVRYGNVVINVDLTVLQNELLSPFEGAGVPIELINQDGFYLASPYQHILFGHLINARKDYTFAKTSPDVWAYMLKATSGIYESDDGSFVFSRFQLPMTVNNGQFSVIVSKIDDKNVVAAALPEMTALRDQRSNVLLMILALSLLIARWVTLRDDYRSLQRMQTAAMRSMSAISITDAKGNIEFVNDAFTTITGYSEEEVLGKNRSIMQSGKQDAEFYKAFWRSLSETGAWQGEIVNKRKDGSLMTEMMSINAIEGRKGQASHYVASFMDITPQKRLEEELMRLSLTDALTGCWNKRHFDQELEREVALFTRYEGRHPTFSLAMLDIDYFKRINDTYGHDIGDKALRQFAKILREQLRDVDLLARIGGEEFAILMPNTNGSSAWIVAERIREAVEKQTEAPSFTCSVGISSFNSGHTKESFVKSTDMAMYQAKENGRNQVMSLLKGSPVALSRGERELSEKLVESKKASDIRANRPPLKVI